MNFYKNGAAARACCCPDRRPGLRSILLIVLASAIAGPVRGATYYLDNSGTPPCANNASGGSESQPWCTFAYAIARLTAGDTLYVKSGIYTGSSQNIAAGASGTLGNPTRLLAYPGATAIIQGNGITGGRLRVTAVSNLIIDGLIVTNFNQGIYVEAGTNVVVQNCIVKGIGQEGIHVNGNSENVTIQNCTVFDVGRGTSTGEGIYIGTGSAGPVDNTSFVTVRSNTVYNTGLEPGGGEAIELKPGTHDCVIEYNTIYNVQSGSGVGAIEISEAILGVQRWDSNPNHIIRNNVLYNMQTGIRAGTGCLIYNNLIYGITNGFYGIYIDNDASDSYPRRVFHNTIDVPSANAVRLVGGPTVNIRNNIGPASSTNLTVNSAYFVDRTVRNYHLVPGSAPVDSGVNLGGVVTVDFDGNARPAGSAPDMGAYEYVATPPEPPERLRIQKPPLP